MAWECLTEQDKRIIKNYIEDYAGDQDYISHPAEPLQTILSSWDKAKNDHLFNLMGGKLILSKQVEYNRSEHQLENEIYKKLLNSNSGRNFINKMKNLYYDSDWRYSENPDYKYAITIFNDIFNGCDLATNSLSCEGKFPMPDGKILKIQKGSKPLKIIGKIAKAYGIEGFEDFRLTHSQILNQKKLSGELCLSIHPMDYMTMSDNHCNWSSCMSWKDEGGYRSGTLEMMNSPYVIVTYLKSSEDMELYEEDTWNNKKWRNLIIATPEFISSVKGYPYQNDDLTAEAIKWVAELGRTNLNWDNPGEVVKYKHYTPFTTHNGHTVKFQFHTNGWMYNDFGTVEHQIAVCNDPSQEIYDFVYGGLPSCMNCGKLGGWEHEDQLYCNDCYNSKSCDCCGDRMYEEYWVDDQCICEDCYDNCTDIDMITNDRHFTEDMVSIVLSATDDERYTEIEDENMPYIITNINTYYWYPCTWKKFFKISAPREYEKTNTWNSSSIFYVCISDLTDEGIRLFEFNSREELNEYLASIQEKLKKE